MIYAALRCSEGLHRKLLCVLYQGFAPIPSNITKRTDASATSDAASGSPNSSKGDTQQAIFTELEKDWPALAVTFRAIHQAPELSVNELQRRDFIASFGAALANLQAPAPNAWQPLPKSGDDWEWPPAPLARLRAAAKIAQNLGVETMKQMWPVLSDTICKVLISVIEAVRANIVHAKDVLTTVFDRERKASLSTYRKQLRRARRDPNFPEFKQATTDLMKQLSALNRREHRVQTISFFPKLYATAHAHHQRFNQFLAKLAQRCAGAVALQAPLKGIGRALEKLILASGAADKVKQNGMEAVDASTLVDVLRGSIKCPDFTEIVFLLEILELLDVDMGDPEQAKAQGWDLHRFQIRIIHVKDRFTTPTSGGWADCMLNISFAHGDATGHVMELQLQVLVPA